MMSLMKNSDRLKILYAMKVLFILISFIIPAVMILWVSSSYSPFREIHVLSNVPFILLFFLIIPVTVSYLIVSLNRIFPVTVRGAFLFFLPYMLNLFIYSLKFGFSEGFFHIWVIHSLPLFLGYILSLTVGFFILFRRRARAHLNKGILGGLPLIFFSAVLILVFLFCWYCMFRSGINLIHNVYSPGRDLTAAVYFGFSIILVFLFHFPLLGILYKEGKL